MNALKPQAHTRTKDDIETIRHLYIDIDHDGSKSLANIGQSELVPPPSFVLEKSPDKFQVIWKVDDINPEQAEAILHPLAHQFEGDPAATDSTRVLRLPGFANKKFDEDFLVKVHSHTGRTHHLRDFKLGNEPVDSGPARWNRPHERSAATGPRNATGPTRSARYPVAFRRKRSCGTLPNSETGGCGSARSQTIGKYRPHSASSGRFGHAFRLIGINWDNGIVGAVMGWVLKREFRLPSWNLSGQ